VIVAVAVELAMAAVVVQGAVDGFTAVCALALAPLGYLFSYRQRMRPNTAAKLIIAVALLAALGTFLRSVRGAASVDDARVPLASLFLWVQVLHSFDVPRRRDLAFSFVSSLILMGEAGSLSLDVWFLAWLVPYAALACAWLVLSARPAAAPPVRHLPPARASGGRLAVARAVGAMVLVSVLATGVAFASIPRLPGFVVSQPFGLGASPTVVPGFSGQVVNPGLPASAPGQAPSFSPNAYPGFGDSMDLRSRGRLSDSIVMRVRAPQASLYRGEVFDTYDGVRWTASETDTSTLNPAYELGRFTPPPSEGETSGAPTRRVIQTFYLQTTEPNVVFSAYRPTEIFFPSTTLEVDLYGSVRSPILLEDGLVYSVVSEVPVTGRRLLRTVPTPTSGLPAEVFARYTQLPAELPIRVLRLAFRIALSAGPAEVDRVLAVQSWLRANTRYNLDIPAETPGVDAVDNFLFGSREGFCEVIASSMVVMLRSQGIPSRIVVGFGPGERNPLTGYYEVRESDAHAWVEVLYPNVGWIPYDPTFGVPAVAPSLGDRFVLGQVLSAVGRWVAGVVPEPVKQAVGATGRGVAALASGVASSWPLAIAATAMALGVVGLWRRRRRVRRRGPPPTGAALAFVELERALARAGNPRAGPQTPTEYLRALVQDGALPGEARADAERVIRAFERERFSPERPTDEEVASAQTAAERVRELVRAR
jgi:transglutaminase-like putative cysteine protease